MVEHAVADGDSLKTLCGILLGAITTLTGVIVYLFKLYVTEKDKRIKDAQTYADLVSKKDAEKAAEMLARLADAKAYGEAIHESKDALDDLTVSVNHMNNHLVDMRRVADARERHELQLENEQLRSARTDYRGPRPPPIRKKIPSSDDGE